MADIELRFDEYTEQFSSKSLAELREYAVTHPIDGPISIEIGANRGKFLTELALRHPERRYLGIEIRRSFAQAAQKLARRVGATNSDTIHADANLAIPILIDDGQLDEMFLLYPDPWWKARHHKRRIIQPDFLDLLSQKMPSGGMVWIRTDVGPLADDMRQTLVDHPEFEPLHLDEFPKDPFPWTNREVHCFAQGLPAHLVYFRRR
ncbi:MAG: tRNA (guanosine(46)-N7)-methyltransferase TrmB [bacterium]